MSEVMPILIEVFAETVRQDDKYGPEQNWQVGGSRMFRATSDRYKERTEQHAQDGTLTWRDILLEETWEAFAEDDVEDVANQRAELIQVAAVAVRVIECIDRKERLRALPPSSIIQFDGVLTEEKAHAIRDGKSAEEGALSEKASPSHEAPDDPGSVRPAA